MKYLLPLILIFSFSFVYSEDWPKWRGLDSDGISKEKGILTKWPKNGLKKVWSISLGSGYSGITVAKNMVFTLYGDDKYENVVAIDTKNGKIIWKRRLGVLFTNYFGNGPRSTPTYHKGKLYVVSSNGDLHCLNYKNGKKIWDMNILQKFDAPNIDWGISSSPFIWKNLLLYNVGGKKGSIVALNKDTGKLVWTAGNDPAGYSTPIEISVDGLLQIVFFTGKSVLGLTPQDGKILWRYEWITDYNVNAATPIFHNNYIFISSGYRSGAALLKLNRKGNQIEMKEMWTITKMKNHFSSSILWDNHIYGFHQGILKCIDFYSGEDKWTQRGFEKGSLVGVDGHIIILGEKGGLAIAELNSESYVQKSTMSIFSHTKCWSVPTVANGNLYVRNEKEMVCLDLKHD